jgi:hypothetical protein
MLVGVTHVVNYIKLYKYWHFRPNISTHSPLLSSYSVCRRYSLTCNFFKVHARYFCSFHVVFLSDKIRQWSNCSPFKTPILFWRYARLLLRLNSKFYICFLAEIWAQPSYAVLYLGFNLKKFGSTNLQRDTDLMYIYTSDKINRYIHKIF